MKWARNPFFKPAPGPPPPSGTATPSPTNPNATSSDPEPASEPDTDTDLEAAIPRPSSSPLRPAELEPTLLTSSPETFTEKSTPPHLPPAKPAEVKEGHRPQRPTPRLTAHQIFYIFVLDGIGAGVLSGGINFAVAYAMYTTTPLPIRLFQLPNTLAGDAAITMILQSIITWLVELVLVNRDLARGGVAPIGFLRQPAWRVARWFMFLDRDGNAEGAEAGSGTWTHWARFLMSQVVRAMVVAVVAFVVLWGPAVGILTAVGVSNGGDWDFEKTWTPQIFKLVLGGVLGLLQTPAFAAFWLVRAGWALSTNEGIRSWS